MLWLISIIAFAIAFYEMRLNSANAGVSSSGFPWTPKSLDWVGAREWMGGMGDWLSGAVSQTGASCASGLSHPAAEALYLSVKNALVFFGWDTAETTRRVYGCLYGAIEGSAVVPASVSALTLLQSLLSVGLIFLFVLGLRNTLKSF